MKIYKFILDWDGKPHSFFMDLRLTIQAFYQQIEYAEKYYGFKLKDFGSTLSEKQIQFLKDEYFWFEFNGTTLNADEFAHVVVGFANFDNNRVVASIVEFPQLELK